ncbi:MAG: hypothetical protein P8Y30_04955 [candidate division WOR-3 bacterium]
MLGHQQHGVRYAGASPRQAGGSRDDGHVLPGALDIDLTSAIVDSSLCVHVLVLLGKDYEEIMPKKILMERRLLENQQ